MRYREAIYDFKLHNHALYEREVDYWTAQLAWACYVDSLCKANIITSKQWYTWRTPFPYGKRLRKSALKGVAYGI